LNNDPKITFFSQRGFGVNIGFGSKPALVVVDMLNAFTDPTSPLGLDMPEVVKAISGLVKTAEACHLPVFFSVTCYKNMTEAGIWFLKQKGLKVLIAGTKAVEVDDRIIKNAGSKTIEKHYASTFFGTDFASQLNSRGIDTLIIVGCSTSGCVRATAVDAISLGFRPIVVCDAVADRSEQAHNQSLFDLGMKYADVFHSKQVIQHLRKIKREGSCGK
jgi:nicotinamidase-related amidase